MAGLAEGDSLQSRRGVEVIDPSACEVSTATAPQRSFLSNIGVRQAAPQILRNTATRPMHKFNRMTEDRYVGSAVIHPSSRHAF